LLLLLLFSGCRKYDDSSIWDELIVQNARLDAIEAQVAGMNTNIETLRALIDAMEGGRYITGVEEFTTPAPGGCKITFSAGTPNPIIIRNGAKGDTGEPGDTPQISVAPDTDGVYYWTLGGAWLTDDGTPDGNKLPVTGNTGEDGQPGATPKVAIGTDNFWYICASGTCTDWTNDDWSADGWIKSVKATGADGKDGDAFFVGIDTTHVDYVVFTLADKTEDPDDNPTFTVPRYRPLGIAFDQPATFTLGQVATATPATVTGIYGNATATMTAVDVPQGWRVTFTGTTPPGAAGSHTVDIHITPPADDSKPYAASGTAILLVSDGAEHTITAPLELSLPPVAEGTTGACSWTLTGVPGSYTLTITPAGGDNRMEDYNDSDNRAPWYNYRDGIKRAVIKDGVTHIGNAAFSYCADLTSVTLPNSVTAIGNFAFDECSGLTSVILPNSVNIIGESAFQGCTGLTSVTIPNSVNTIGDGAFAFCERLTSVTIPNSVTTIGESAFAHTGLTSVTLGNSVNTIGDGAFYGCTGLTGITSLNAAPPALGDYAFLNVPIGSGALSVPAGAVRAYKTTGNWANNTFGKYIPLYDPGEALAIEFTQPAAFGAGEQKDVGYNTGYYVHSITAVNVPAGWTVTPDVSQSKIAITAPADYTASGTVTLLVSDGAERTVTVPLVLSFSTVAEGATGACLWALTGVPGNYTLTITPNGGDNKMADYAYNVAAPWNSYRDDIKRVVIKDGVTTIGNEAFYDFYGLTGALNIPNSVTTIGVNAFHNCNNLTSVTIGNSVTTIGVSAFYQCAKLTSVTIGNSVETIGNWAFGYCYGLTGALNIPNSVETIGERAFYYCSYLMSVTIGNSVTTIGEWAFYGCSDLTTVTNLHTPPQSINSNTFHANAYNNGTLKVPESAVSAYKNANEWNRFSNIVRIE
jgi:hypothetical protein